MRTVSLPVFPFLSLFLFLSLAAHVTVAKTDSLVMGQQYANQVWYSLSTGQSAIAAQAAWDLAFETTSVSGTTASVLINEGKGAVVYVVPEKTIDDWTTIDTAGLSTWKPLHNSVISWSEGALNTARDVSDEFDFGWGSYSMVSHQVLGTKVFIYKHAARTLKLRIDGLINGAFKFTYANLDGSDQHEGTVTRLDYNGKLFAYWSFDTHATIDREPSLAEWDITMLKYVDVIPAGPGTTMAYPVTGILVNPKSQVAKVISSTPETEPAPAGDQFTSNINGIGWDWKSFTNGAFTVADSSVYFIRQASGTMYRLVFTGFSGSGSGVTKFTSDSVGTSSVNSTMPVASLAVFPSVVPKGSDFEVVTTLAGSGTIQLYDVAGSLARSFTVTDGFTATRCSTAALAPGAYMVVVNNNNTVTTARIIIQ